MLGLPHGGPARETPGRERSSRRRARGAVAALAVLGLAISAYLAAYQLGAVAAPWDPIFGPASAARVLGSPLSRALPIPDAALGAVAYAAELALELAGGPERWRTHPGVVIALAVVAAGLALAGVALAVVQAAFVRAGCTLCLCSAAVSVAAAVVVLGGGEPQAALRAVRAHEVRRGHGTEEA